MALPTIPDNINNKNLKKKIAWWQAVARHWQDIEKYMHAVEDASVQLTNSPMGVGKKQRRLNPVERSQSGPISTPVLTQSDSARIETRFSWEFAGQSWCFFWRPSLLGPPNKHFGCLAEWARSFVYASFTYLFPQRMHSWKLGTSLAESPSPPPADILVPFPPMRSLFPG